MFVFKLPKKKKRIRKKRRKPFVQEIPLLHHLITTVEKCCWTKKGEINLKTNQIKVNRSFFFLRDLESCNTSLTFNFSRYDRKRIFIRSGMGMKKKKFRRKLYCSWPDRSLAVKYVWVNINSPEICCRMHP